MGHAADGFEFLESGILLVLLRVDCLDAAEYRLDLFTAGGRASVHLSTVLASFLARNAGRFGCSFLGFFNRIISAGRLAKKICLGFQSRCLALRDSGFFRLYKIIKIHGEKWGIVVDCICNIGPKGGD